MKDIITFNQARPGFIDLGRRWPSKGSMYVLQLESDGMICVDMVADCCCILALEEKIARVPYKSAQSDLLGNDKDVLTSRRRQ